MFRPDEVHLNVTETSCYFFIVDFSFKMYVEIDRYQNDILYKF